MARIGDAPRVFVYEWPGAGRPGWGGGGGGGSSIGDGADVLRSRRSDVGWAVPCPAEMS